jgi:WD40 repeat protein
VQVFTGHSSHVTNVRFLWDDKTVITAGGNDRCLFQWKL